MPTSLTAWVTSNLVPIVLAILTVITIIFNYRVARPKRLVLINLPHKPVPLVESRADSWPSLLTLEAGDSIEYTHLLDVKFSAKGRLDVPSKFFDQDLPIVIDVGTSILAVNISSPPGAAHLKAETNGTELRIGPSLIHHGMTWGFALLIVAPTFNLSWSNPLIDVSVRSEIQWLKDVKRWRYRFLIVIVAAAVYIVLRTGPVRR